MQGTANFPLRALLVEKPGELDHASRWSGLKDCAEMQALVVVLLDSREVRGDQVLGGDLAVLQQCKEV